jgi:Uma2 family endonuclease
MATIVARRKAKKKQVVFGIESNGILMTPEEFDEAEFDDDWYFELINGVLVVSPIPSEEEVDPNEELGFLLRLYQETHPKGKALDKTLPERYVKAGRNRRRPDRVIWTGLGRLPRKDEKPSIIVEFASKRRRDRERDYETKRDEYHAINVQEYWIIDRFTQAMTVFFFEADKPRHKVILAKQTYRTKLLPGFELPLARLFALAAQWSEQEGALP